MAKVGYTEFSFGYAFTENLLRSSITAPSGAPIFPNLVQEGQLGFDVRINYPATPLFFQFKLPERMQKNSAFEIARWSCPRLSVPFFRISMMQRNVSRQHQRLMELEADFPNGVYYAAPWLANINSFNGAYNRGEVAENSAFFSPLEIGSLPDNRLHTLAYRADLDVGYFCSEPRKIVARDYRELLANVIKLFDEKRFSSLSYVARQTREALLKRASPAWQRNEDQISERYRTRIRFGREVPLAKEVEEAIVDLLFAREIARVDLGIEMLLAQPR